MKKDAKDDLAKYARKQHLENTKGWTWVKEYLRSKSGRWFERTQDCVADIKQTRDYDRLTTSLHSAYKRSKGGHDKDTTEALGRAFKKSIDIRKHGGKVGLDYTLRSHIREKALHKYL
jgi:hypothetical protein